MPLIPWIFDYFYIPFGVALLGAGISLYTDVKMRKIKNFVTFPMILFGLAWSWIFGGIELMGINLAVSIVIGFLTVLTGQIGEGDIKLIVGIAACLQPMLNVMFVLLYFVTLLIAAILRRLSIYNFNPQKALLAMGTEMMLDFNYFVEKVATLGLLKGIVATLGKDTGALDIAYADVPSGKGIKRIGGPVIFIALVATIARISWILGVVL